MVAKVSDMLKKLTYGEKNINEVVEGIDNNFVGRLVDIQRKNFGGVNYDHIDMAREIMHIRDVEIPKLNDDIQKNIDIKKILEMYCKCMTVILHRIMNDLNKYKFNEDNYVKDLLSIKEFTNDCFEDVNKMYNCEKYIDDYCIFWI